MSIVELDSDVVSCKEDSEISLCNKDRGLMTARNVSKLTELRPRYSNLLPSSDNIAERSSSPEILLFETEFLSSPVTVKAMITIRFREAV